MKKEGEKLQANLLKNKASSPDTEADAQGMDFQKLLANLKQARGFLHISQLLSLFVPVKNIPFTR